MTEMIERVAGALQTYCKQDAQAAREMANIAIGVMREPSAALEAWFLAGPGWMADTEMGEKLRQAALEDFRLEWRQMIDVCLGAHMTRPSEMQTPAEGQAQ